MSSSRRVPIARIATVALVAAVWLTAPPEGLSVQAWRLFGIFTGAIVAVVVNALPIPTASVLALAAAVLTGLLRPADKHAGFGNATILLIVVAFLVADYFSVITPQGSSVNLLFAGSGFLSQNDLYKRGAITTAVSFLVYAVVGTAWLWLVVR